MTEPPATPPPGWQPVAPNHPQAILALVLGIIGLVTCQVLSPFAWYLGAKAVKEIDASPGVYSGRSEANIGKILGIIGTVLLALGALILVGFLVLLVIGGVVASEGMSTASI